MRIKKIELTGFKSFADRTEIHLGQGVTCVVGPNGCGKSNISDAIRWVFGERSAKLLRGTRMEDVIFNGTDFRKPMGMVEVSLTIDNEDHRLPIEYNEVVFSRRLYRSGQSEYLLNKTPCRLRDILDLILDTGMGSNSYSMIEQGRVDFIINANPQEKRFLIEEAAGISKYKVKKEEALRKLERTEQNLLRIRDMVSEIQKNIQYAEKQARRAERYKVQFEELKRLEICKAFLELAEFAERKSVEDEKKRGLQDSLHKMERGLHEILTKEEEQKKLLQEVSKKESSQAELSFELRSEHTSLIQKQEFNRERLQQCRQRFIEIEKEKEILNSQLTEFEKEIRSNERKQQSTEEEYQAAREAFQQGKKAFEEEEVKFEKTRDESEKLKKALFENASESTAVKNEANRLKTLLERTEHERNKRKGAREKLGGEKGAFEKKRISYQEELSGAGKEGLGEGSEKEGIAKLLDEMRFQVECLEKRIDEKGLKFQELNSRMILLEELEETAEEAERKLLASVSGNRIQGKLVHSLREVLQIQKGYEGAVEAVLGSFAQGLVAEDVETAKGLLFEMEEAHVGPCGIFIQSLIKPNGKRPKSISVSHPKVRHAIADVVHIKTGFESLFESLFENVYIVEDFIPEHLGELLPLTQGTKLVTRQGIILGPEARIFFRNGRISPDQGSFHRQAEIQNLKSDCETLNQDLETARNKKRELEKQISSLQQEQEAAEEKKRDTLVRKEATGSILHGLNERLESIEAEILVLEMEESQSQKETEQIQSRLVSLEANVLRLEQNETEILENQREVERALEEMQKKREEQIRNLSRLKTLLENHEERLQVVETTKNLLTGQTTNAKERTSRLTAEAEEMNRRSQEISMEEAVLKKHVERVDQEQKEAERLLNEIRGRRAFQEEKHQELSTQSVEHERQINQTKESLHEQELKMMDLSYREKNVSERLNQTYHIKLNELRPEDFLKEGLNAGALEEELQVLKSKVEAFGPVNLLAVEEYEELKQRYDFMVGQEKDLNDAKESLLEAIRRINRTTKTLFAETFQKAQSLFQEYYQILFNGGRAELILLEGEESQEEGVDIMVHPPGKKPQHISLLSGGEKALTAMALLFALFRIKPSPLCVLDEVDAPLDEANIDRFLTVLKTFLEATQFLVITHNRKTIAMGDFLYGVTMEEAGVSKIVSVKVAHAETTEEKAVAA